MASSVIHRVVEDNRVGWCQSVNVECCKERSIRVACRKKYHMVKVKQCSTIAFTSDRSLNGVLIFFRPVRTECSSCRGVLVFPNFCKILWSLCLVVFHALTLKHPIQTSLSVASKLQVCVCSGEK